MGPKWPRHLFPSRSEGSENTAWEVPCKFRMIPWHPMTSLWLCQHTGATPIKREMIPLEKVSSRWRMSVLQDIHDKVQDLRLTKPTGLTQHTKQTLKVWHRRRCSTWMNLACSTFFGLPLNMESNSLCFQRNPQTVFKKWQYQPWPQIFSLEAQQTVQFYIHLLIHLAN